MTTRGRFGFGLLAAVVVGVFVLFGPVDGPGSVGPGGGVDLGFHVDATTLALLGLVGLVYAAGVLIARVEPDRFGGLRPPRALADDAVWNRTTALAGRLLQLSALVGLLALAVGADAGYGIVVAPLLVAVLVVGYAYLAHASVGGARESPDDR